MSKTRTSLCLYPLHVIYLCILNVKIKAWLADKDAEALRCQNLLVEEEEAARRRYVLIIAMQSYNVAKSTKC